MLKGKRQLRDLWRKAKDPQNVILKFQNSTTMKTMQNFAAQQLTKKQMSNVKGGAKFICSLKMGDAPATSGIVEADTSDRAAAKLALVYMPMITAAPSITVDIACRPA